MNGRREKLEKGPLALYEQMRLKILDLIEERGLCPHDPVPSETELAALYGVSTRTSKQALQRMAQDGLVYRLPRRGTFLSEKYRTGAAAPSSPPAMPRAISMIVPEIDEYVGSVLAAVSEEALRGGYETVLRLSRGDLREEEEVIRDLLENVRPAGIILFPGDRKSCGDEVLRLHLSKFPVVIADRTFREIPIPSVYHDHYDGAYRITEYLIGQGHTAIGFFSEQVTGIMSREERFQGFVQAHLDAGLAILSKRVFTELNANGGAPDTSGNRTPTENYLADNRDMTAVVCSNDKVALQVMNSARSIGIRVPEDLSVTGYTDHPVSGLPGIELTTVRKPPRELGIAAVNLLLERISSPDAGQADLKLPIELVIRKSVARI